MHQASNLGKLKLAVNPQRDPEYIRLVVAQIQQLPGVVHVHTNQPTAQIEIMFSHPVECLLRTVRVALRMAGNEIVAGKSF